MVEKRGMEMAGNTVGEEKAKPAKSRPSSLKDKWYRPEFVWPIVVTVLALAVIATIGIRAPSADWDLIQKLAPHLAWPAVVLLLGPIALLVLGPSLTGLVSFFGNQGKVAQFSDDLKKFSEDAKDIQKSIEESREQFKQLRSDFESWKMSFGETIRDIKETKESINEIKETTLEQANSTYWDAFADFLKNRNATIKPPRKAPSTRNCQFGSIGNGFVLSATALRRGPRKLFAGINVRKNQAFRRLHSDRSTIENDFGARLDWNEGKTGGWIGVADNRFDPKDKAGWEDQYKWLLENLEKLRRVFESRITALNIDETENLSELGAFDEELALQAEVPPVRSQ